MDYSLSNLINEKTPTKQKIMICALRLFCTKGYIETTVRDIASAVGITSGSIYSHFSSKEEMLMYILNDYSEYTKNMFSSFDIRPILENNPTGEGIAECFMSSSSILIKDPYYANLVHLIHQEQHRNSLFGNIVLLRLQETTEFVERIFNLLKEMNVIKADAEAEYWGVFAYSLLHFIPTCVAISISQKIPGYTVMDLKPMLATMFDAMLDAYKPPNEPPNELPNEPSNEPPNVY